MYLFFCCICVNLLFYYNNLFHYFRWIVETKFVVLDIKKTPHYSSFVSRLHGLVSARQSDKQTLASLEKRLQEERRCRLLVETQLANERRARANDVIEASKAQR